MNKHTIITTLLALVAMMGQAQEIKMNEASFNDYLPLLNAKGYMAYSFDVSAINGKNVTFNCLILNKVDSKSPELWRRLKNCCSPR